MSDHHSIDDERIARALEALCAHGCQAVWGIIEELEAGAVRPEVEHLVDGERRVVIRELKAVMAVYGSCSLNKD